MVLISKLVSRFLRLQLNIHKRKWPIFLDVELFCFIGSMGRGFELDSLVTRFNNMDQLQVYTKLGNLFKDFDAQT